MGAHSSLQITRKKALDLFYDAGNFFAPCNRELEHWLDELLYDMFYNVVICDEEDISYLSSGMWLSSNYLRGY